MGKPTIVTYVNKANAFYQHINLGRSLIPLMEEGIEDLTHFGIPVELAYYNPGVTGAVVAVLPWGAFVPPEDC